MKEKFYIDFDSTLFDSSKYLHKLYVICEKYKISRTELDEITDSIFEHHKNFFIDDLLKYLIEEKKVDKNIKEDFKILENTSFLYEDSILFLKNIQNKYNLILLTCGNISNQQKKIDACDIKKYFSNIIITPGNKSTVQEVEYQNSIFLDNNPKEVERFVSVGAKRVIRIKRDTDKYSKIPLKINGIEEYSSLYEVLEGLGIKQDEYLL
ncbi:MAG: HAD hydrolase-like protein [Bacilli bacterium]|nr:HAD hydrolase-like protein [Bacilli bacterium]